MNKWLAVIFVDDKLKAGELLVTIRSFNLIGYVGRRLALSLQDPNRQEGPQFISPQGLATVEYRWPVEVHERHGTGYFIVGGDLTTQTQARPHVANLYDEQGNAVARSIIWPARANHPRWVEPAAGAPIAAPPPPSPAIEKTEERESPRGDPTVKKDGPLTGRWQAYAAAALVVLLASAIGWWTYPAWAPAPQPSRLTRNLSWPLTGASGELELASMFEMGRAPCKPPVLRHMPAFGEAIITGGKISYARRASSGSMSEAGTDALDYEIVCGNTTWFGTVTIKPRPMRPTPIELRDIEVRLPQTEPTMLAIGDLPLGARLPPGDWRWSVAPQGPSILSTASDGGRRLEIILLSGGSVRAPFELKASDGTYARGTMVVIPESN